MERIRYIMELHGEKSVEGLLQKYYKCIVEIEKVLNKGVNVDGQPIPLDVLDMLTTTRDQMIADCKLMEGVIA
jgi:hypothetical protein